MGSVCASSKVTIVDDVIDDHTDAKDQLADNQKNSPPAVKTDIYDMNLVCLGYIRRLNNEMRIDDIAKLVCMYAQRIDWRFDYTFDYRNKGSFIHGIETDGKRLKCNYNGYGCYCFFGIYSFGMKPNHGMYTIKIEINKIDSGSNSNMIGIISDNLIQDNSNFVWITGYKNYIGWSANNRVDNEYLPYGLSCGGMDRIRQNIFRVNKFVYQSNNEYYKTRLPAIKSGDTIILSYNSNKRILLFGKENDNGKLDAQISNLPKRETFYWFVGHYTGNMSLTIVE